MLSWLEKGLGVLEEGRGLLGRAVEVDEEAGGAVGQVDVLLVVSLVLVSHQHLVNLVGVVVVERQSVFALVLAHCWTKVGSCVYFRHRPHLFVGELPH